MVAAARIVVALRDIARARAGARATVGRLTPLPGGTNVIASRVELWVDVRHPDTDVVTELVRLFAERAVELAAEEGCAVSLAEESFSPTVDFDARLRDRLRQALPTAALLGTGAGHDAGVLKERVSAAMLFVRNPTGISHSPEETAGTADCLAGVEALAHALTGLVG